MDRFETRSTHYTIYEAVNQQKYVDEPGWYHIQAISSLKSPAEFWPMVHEKKDLIELRNLLNTVIETLEQE